jgi:hypothetical protein
MFSLQEPAKGNNEARSTDAPAGAVLDNFSFKLHMFIQLIQCSRLGGRYRDDD